MKIIFPTESDLNNSQLPPTPSCFKVRIVWFFNFPNVRNIHPLTKTRVNFIAITHGLKNSLSNPFMFMKYVVMKMGNLIMIWRKISITVTRTSAHFHFSMTTFPGLQITKSHVNDSWKLHLCLYSSPQISVTSQWNWHVKIGGEETSANSSGAKRRDCQSICKSESGKIFLYEFFIWWSF